MPATQHIAQFYVMVNGRELGAIKPEYSDNLISVEVDDSLYLPDMFVLHLKDPELEMLKNNVFQLGSEVKITATPPPVPPAQSPGAPVVLMVGEITGIEPDLNAVDRATLVIRGYDRSHKMHRVRETKTYQQVTDSDLARQLAGASGLSAQVTATSVVYPYLMQANQTDWEFLMERARRIGYRLFVEDRKLHFEPPPRAPRETRLEWGIDLAQFRARLSTIDQVSKVTVRGWNPKTKQAIVGQASSATQTHQIGESRTGGQAAQAAHGRQGTSMVVDLPVFTQSEADKLAKARLDDLSAGFVQAEGSCAGQPAIQAGTFVNITGVGDRFGGKYLVTRALHRYSAKAGYTVQFWISGGDGTMSITDLLSNGNGHGPGANGDKPTERGLMVGIVTNNKDPENMGRVKVKFPALGDNVESYWCRMVAPMSGGVRGIAFFPEANDEVVVAFQNGDPNNGYVLGAVWNGSDSLPKPPAQLVTGGQTIRRVIRTRVGHEMVFDDTPDPGGITLIDKTLKNKIQINTKLNKIEIVADQDIQITSTLGKVTIKGQQGVDIEGDPGKVTINGKQGVDIASNPAKVTINGTQGVDVNSNVKVSIGGPMIDVNGNAVVNIKGGVVKLN